MRFLSNFIVRRLLLHFWRLNAGFPKNPLDGNTRATHVCLLKDGVKISLLFTLSRSFKSNLYYIAKLLCITLRFTARWSYIAFYTLPLFYLLHMVSRALTLEEKREKRRCVQRVTPSSGKLGSKSNLSLPSSLFSQRWVLALNHSFGFQRYSRVRNKGRKEAIIAAFFHSSFSLTQCWK